MKRARTTVALDAITTGEAGKIAGVAPRTVVSWIDRGLLEAWRIPGSTHRRISRASLLKLMEECGMPKP